MRFLLTNDDGIDAPGLSALAAATPARSEPLIVAPSTEQSGVGHRVTTHTPIRLTEHAPRRWAVGGAPADCVRVALNRFRGEFDCVLAGINAGGNLGVDVYHSGTIAAVREAVIHGVPGVAVSQYRNRPLTAEDWARAARWARPVVEDLIARPAERGVLWSINLPCLHPDAADPEVVFCSLDLSPLPLEFREDGDHLHYAGVYHRRARTPGGDIDTCFSGRIAVTRLQLA